MYAIVVSVKLDDPDQARAFLKEEIVPMVSQAPGFVAGWWVSIDNAKGRGTIVFESEEAAREVAAGIGQQEGEAVTLESVEVGQVEAHA